MQSESPTFLLGYNVASSPGTPPTVIGDFLRAAVRLHGEMQIPCTFFVRGWALEAHVDEFRRARDVCGEMIDFQQYTYSGLPLKTVCQDNHRGVQVFPGGSLEECRADLERATGVFEHVFGERPVGLAGPLGYYRGLCDRPDILEVLRDLGIRFTRTYTRNARDWSPVAFEVQPFCYEAQGFGDILEIPGQGWPDALLKEALGLGALDRYVQHVRKDLDYVSARQLTWSFVQHDWSSIAEDPDMNATRAVLGHVKNLGFKVQTHRQYFEGRCGSVG